MEQFIRRESHFRSRRKRKLAPSQSPAQTSTQTPTQTPTPPARKSRPGRTSPKTSNLRKLAKDATRRRFFEQCMKLESLLWSRQEGHRKAVLNEALFVRAAKDPVDELYAAHPGALHSVSHSKLQGIVKWQVCFVV